MVLRDKFDCSVTPFYIYQFVFINIVVKKSELNTSRLG